MNYVKLLYNSLIKPDGNIKRNNKQRELYYDNIQMTMISYILKTIQLRTSFTSINPEPDGIL